MTTYCRPPKGYGHGELLRLAPFQVEFLEEVLADGVTAGVLELPRGNGKSTFMAALALWGLFDVPETGAPQIPIVATRVQQAIRSVYGVAAAMVAAEPELDERCIRYTSMADPRTECAQTGGSMFPLANAVEGLQGLDPSLAIADEIGFQPIEAWDSLLLAQGKRERSLVVGCGTPGLDRENALYRLRQVARSGHSPAGFVFVEYAADEGCDARDEAQWAKANPALVAGYMNPGALRTALELSPEAHFRIFHLGQWVDGTDAWLGSDGRKVWEGLADRDYELVEGMPTWIGLDVGIKRDSTALVMAQRRIEQPTLFEDVPEGPTRLHFTCRTWVPSGDEAIDVTEVMAAIREADKRYKLVEVAYDPRFFEVPATMLADERIPMVEMHQSLERMTPAFGSLYEAIMRGEITQDGGEAFTEQVLAAVPRLNERGFTLQKAKSRGRIDAAYALAMCHDRAQWIPKARRPLVIV